MGQNAYLRDKFHCPKIYKDRLKTKNPDNFHCRDFTLNQLIICQKLTR